VDIAERIRRGEQADGQRPWHGDFAQYLEICRQRPHVADLAHRRMHRMLVAAGGAKGLCEGQLFGLDAAFSEIDAFFAAAAQGLEVRRRILLLLGPVGGGKSSFVEILKRGLERFSQSGEGSLYAIAGCPMREEPLHLLNGATREAVAQELGVTIEGDLCPVCRMRYGGLQGEELLSVPVERVLISEERRRGIGTFAPSDPKSQDIAELTGSLDLAAISDYGVESDPRAFRFDGELNVANRGLMEFVELLKCDERFLYTLLTLAQEGRFKTGRYALMYADEVVVAHTNEAEYQAFIHDPRNEALKDRIVVVRMPYALRLRDEKRIYERLVAQRRPPGVHIAPHAIEAAAMFAVLTRLEPSRRREIGQMQKLRLYDEEQPQGLGERDRRDLQRESLREGMHGISPRYIVNQLAQALVRCDGCLTVGLALRALYDGLPSHPSIDAGDQETYRNLLHEVAEDLGRRLEGEVYPHFVAAFEDNLATLWHQYLEGLDAYLLSMRLGQPTEEEVEQRLRSVEEEIGVAESQKRAFREEIGVWVASVRSRGQIADLPQHPALRAALERHLYSRVQTLLQGALHDASPGEGVRARIAEVREKLAAEGYCPICGDDLLRTIGGPVPFAVS
jgi:serine protein kinase